MTLHMTYELRWRIYAIGWKTPRERQAALLQPSHHRDEDTVADRFRRDRYMEEYGLRASAAMGRDTGRQPQQPMMEHGVMSWPFYAALSAVFAALVAIFRKIGLARIDPTLGAAVRSVIMAVFMVSAVIALKKFDSAVFSSSSREWLFITLAGAAGALSWLFYFVVLRTGPASGVSAIDRLSIIVVIFLAALTLGEKLTWMKLLGGLLIVAGAVLVAL